jgi:hypothetical protein
VSDGARGSASQRSAALVALALAAGVAVWAPAAAAHMGSTKYLFVTRAGGGAVVRAEVEVVDAAYELGDPEAGEGAVLARAGAVQAWLERALHLRSADGEPCVGRAEGEVSARTRDGKRYLAITLGFRCADPAARLVLRDDAVFDDDPQHEAIVRIDASEESVDALVERAARAGAGPGPDARPHGAAAQDARATVLRATSRELRLEPPDRPLLDLVGTFLVEGALHLVTGYDHLLFLLSLLLVAGTQAAREGTRRALREVALVVTGFTVGHSVTLVAAALDWLVLPSRPVEVAIAASIVLVAAWNVARPEPRRSLPAVATAFGLVHGFGFSSVLRELVLPTEGRVVALLAFNVGIELAQLACVLAALGPLAWAARRPWYRRAVVQGGSAAIATVAAYWMVARALGLD